MTLLRSNLFGNTRPLIIPETVLRSMHRSSPNIYEGELIEITESLIPDLNYVVLIGHVRILPTVMGFGRRHYQTWFQRFAPHDLHGWAEMAKKMGIVDILDFGKKEPSIFNFKEN